MSDTAIKKTIVLSLVYFVTLALVMFLAWKFIAPENREVDTIFAVISIMPIVFYLILSGKIVGFKGGGIELTLKNEAEKSVLTQFDDKQIEFDEEILQLKGSISELASFGDRPPTTLVLNVGRANYYVESAIRRYIDELTPYPDFRYILFTDRSHRFLGYMHAGDFLEILKSSRDSIVQLLETGDILNNPGIQKDCISKGATNKEVLNRMDSLNIQELAVVDENYRFLGTVNQSDIVRKVLTNVIKEA